MKAGPTGLGGGEADPGGLLGAGFLSGVADTSSMSLTGATPLLGLVDALTAILTIITITKFSLIVNH
jgi:hypothetical protein